MILCIGFSCVEEEKKSGYNCVSGQCTATFENPTYLTLQDCQSACSTSNPPPVITKGKIVFYITFSTMCRYFSSSYTVNVVNLGYGYSSTDVANGAYIQSWKITESQKQIVLTDITPGIYYYKAVRSSTDSYCPTVTKSGAITVESGKTTSITVNLN